MTSLDHTQFRQYSSQLARWLSPDPADLLAVSLDDPQSLNRYSYVENDPMDWIDPSGLVLITNIFVPYTPGCTAVSCGGCAFYVLHGTSETGYYYEPYFCGGGSSGQSGGSNTGGGSPTMGPASKAPTVPKCRIVDPVLAALEFTGKLGPELQFGPFKAGFSLYKNITTGDTGGKAELNAGLFHVQADNPTPMGGSLGGGSEGNQYSASFLGFQYNFNTNSLSFSPSKSFTLGLQALVGGELSFNSDTYKKVIAANAACRAHGGADQP